MVVLVVAVDVADVDSCCCVLGGLAALVVFCCCRLSLLSEP